MPAMLSTDDAQKWLAVDDEIAHALTLLKPYPPGEDGRLRRVTAGEQSLQRFAGVHRAG